MMSPFKALYGREPPALIKYETCSTSNEELEERLIERDQMLTVIKGHLHKAQQKMKVYTDNHRREVEFKEGDMVYLKMRPYIRVILVKGANEKLDARFYGPYQVKGRVEKVAYKLKLPPEAKIHSTFHVS